MHVCPPAGSTEHEPPFWQGLGLHAPAGTKHEAFQSHLHVLLHSSWRIKEYQVEWGRCGGPLIGGLFFAWYIIRSFVLGFKSFRKNEGGSETSHTRSQRMIPFTYQYPAFTCFRCVDWGWSRYGYRSWSRYGYRRWGRYCCRNWSRYGYGSWSLYGCRSWSRCGYRSWSRLGSRPCEETFGWSLSKRARNGHNRWMGEGEVSGVLISGLLYGLTHIPVLMQPNVDVSLSTVVASSIWHSNISR